MIASEAGLALVNTAGIEHTGFGQASLMPAGFSVPRWGGCLALSVGLHLAIIAAFLNQRANPTTAIEKGFGGPVIMLTLPAFAGPASSDTAPAARDSTAAEPVSAPPVSAASTASPAAEPPVAVASNEAGIQAAPGAPDIASDSAATDSVLPTRKRIAEPITAPPKTERVRGRQTDGRTLASTQPAPILSPRERRETRSMQEPRSASGAASGVALPPGPAATSPVAASSAAAESTEPLIVQARYRERPTPPAYPPRAFELDQQGEVVVRARLDPHGDPQRVEVLRSSGFSLLDEAALAAVRRWRFEPARIDGRPVPAIVQVPVRFRVR